MEFLNVGSLKGRLERERVFSEEQTAFFTAQILCGLSYLHSKQIIHR